VCVGVMKRSLEVCHGCFIRWPNILYFPKVITMMQPVCLCHEAILGCIVCHGCVIRWPNILYFPKVITMMQPASTLDCVRVRDLIKMDALHRAVYIKCLSLFHCLLLLR